jgi:hypothetical protein
MAQAMAGYGRRMGIFTVLLRARLRGIALGAAALRGIAPDMGLAPAR